MSASIFGEYFCISPNSNLFNSTRSSFARKTILPTISCASRQFAPGAGTTKRARDIFCYIATSRHRRVEKEILIEVFWSEAELDAIKKNFHLITDIPISAWTTAVVLDSVACLILNVVAGVLAPIISPFWKTRNRVSQKRWLCRCVWVIFLLNLIGLH